MNENIVFDLGKFKVAVHYIISKCGSTDNAIEKLLYFSDFNYYELNEVPITGEKYIKKHHGPVPVHFTDAAGELEYGGKISIHKEDDSNHFMYKYSSISNPDISLLKMMNWT